MARQNPPLVACGTLGGSEDGMVRADIADLDVPELAPVGLELQVCGPVPGVTILAVFLVMAAGAGLGIVLGLYGMDLYPVALVTFGDIIPPVILG